MLRQRKKPVFDRFNLQQLLKMNDRVGEHAIFMCFLLTKAPCNNQEGISCAEKGCSQAHEQRATCTLLNDDVPESAKIEGDHHGVTDTNEVTMTTWFSPSTALSENTRAHRYITLSAFYISSLVHRSSYG